MRARGRTEARWGRNEEIVIGSVGRLERKRRQDIALEIIASSVARGFLYGISGLATATAAEFQERRSPRHRESRQIRGWRDDVPAAYRVRICSSCRRGLRYAFGALEAMGAGLCCCVSDVDGMGEVIKHGEWVSVPGRGCAGLVSAGRRVLR